MGIETCGTCMWFEALEKETACPKCNTKNTLAFCARAGTIHCLECEDFPVSYNSKAQEPLSEFGICRYPAFICNVSGKFKKKETVAFAENPPWIGKLFVHKSFSCIAWEIRREK